MRCSVPVGEGLNHKENPVAQEITPAVESPAAAVVAPASADLACGTAKLQGDVAGTPNANGSPRKDRSSGIVGRALFRRGQRLRSPGCATPKTSPAW